LNFELRPFSTIRHQISDSAPGSKPVR
jgi:hypothetical protein